MSGGYVTSAWRFLEEQKSSVNAGLHAEEGTGECEVGAVVRGEKKRGGKILNNIV